MSDRAELLARHISPDGELVWRIEREEGDVIFGFEGLPWHLHSQMLTADRPSLEVTLDVTDRLLADRLLVVRSDSPAGVEFRLADDIETEIAFKYADEQLSFRFWSGRPAAVEDLIDGKVAYEPFKMDYCPTWRRPFTPPQVS